MSTDLRQLSEREHEILRLVATGATNQQIANTLDISANTVKVHLRNIFSKIGVASRTEATVYAMRQGFVAVEEFPGAPDTADTLPSEREASSTQTTEALSSNRDTIDTDTASIVQVEEASEDLLSSIPQTDLIPAARLWSSTRLVIGGAVLLVAVVLILGAIYQFRHEAAPSTTSGSQIQPERWHTHAAPPNVHSDFALAAQDTYLYAIGGSTATGPSDSVERLDLSNNVWVPLSAKPTPVTQVQAVTVGGRIYVPGGEGKAGVLNIFEAYDPRSERWETLPSLPAPRSRYALATVEGRIYLFGGWDGTHYAADVFIYDPIARAWTKGVSMPTPRRQAAAAVVDDRIYVIGGENDTGPLTINQRYDPTDDGPEGHPWVSVVPLPNAIAAPAAAGIANIIVAFDPQRHLALQYISDHEAWSAIPIPDTIGISSRAVPSGVSVYIFGAADGQQRAVGEYQAIYTTYLPSSGR